MLKSICRKFIKPSVMDKVTSGTKLNNLDLESNSNFKSMDSIEIGFGAKYSLKNAKEVNVKIRLQKLSSGAL